jgi:hypothetical protein
VPREHRGAAGAHELLAPAICLPGREPCFKIFPEYDAHGDHAEAEQKIFQRDGADPVAQELLRVIHDDPARQIAVNTKFETENDGKKEIEYSPAQHVYAAYPVKHDGYNY